MKKQNKKLALIAASALALAFGQAQVQAQELIDKPEPRSETKSVKTIDSAFLTHTGLDLALSLGDAAYSNRTKSLPGIYETDGLFGKHPSATRYFVQSIGVSAALGFAAYEAKKHNQKWWGLVQAADEISHFVGIMQTHSAVTASNQFCQATPSYSGCHK